MDLPTITDMWKELIEFDPTIRVIYNQTLRKTYVETDYIIYSIADHIDKAIYEAWLIIQRNKQL